MGISLFSIKSKYYISVIQMYLNSHQIVYDPDNKDYQFSVGNAIYSLSINNGFITMTNNYSNDIEVFDFNIYNNSSQIFAHYKLEKENEDTSILYNTIFNNIDGNFVLTVQKNQIEVFDKSREAKLFKKFFNFIGGDNSNVINKIKNSMETDVITSENEEYVLRLSDNAIDLMYNAYLPDVKKKERVKKSGEK